MGLTYCPQCEYPMDFSDEELEIVRFDGGDLCFKCPRCHILFRREWRMARKSRIMRRLE